MKVQKNVLATGIALTLMLGSGASFGFGIPKLPGKPAAAASGGVSADAVDQFIVAGQVSSATINDARSMLAAALSTKDERAKLISQREQIKKGLDAKDKKAADESKAFNESADAQIKAALADQQKLDTLKVLTADQRKAVANSALSLAYSVILQKEQVTAGQTMITQVSSNPLLATKLPAIKDTVSTMTTNLAGTAGYLASFPKLFSALGISAKMPQSKDDKPTEAPANLADVFGDS